MHTMGNCVWYKLEKNWSLKFCSVGQIMMETVIKYFSINLYHREKIIIGVHQILSQSILRCGCCQLWTSTTHYLCEDFVLVGPYFGKDNTIGV